MEEKTLKERIIDFARNRYYFHINDLKKHLSKMCIEYNEETLKKPMYRLKNETMIYEAGRGWYSIIEKIFELETAPVEEIRVLIEGKFPLVKFSCWSTEQLKSYFHHLPTRFVTFVYADKDFLQPLKDFLEDSGYNVYLNPTVTETAKYVDLKNHAVILRPPISYRDSNNQQLAKIEKVLVDLFMEARNVNLLDREEYTNIMANIILTYRVNIAEMLDYAHNRKIKSEIRNIITAFSGPLMRPSLRRSH